METTKSATIQDAPQQAMNIHTLITAAWFHLNSLFGNIISSIIQSRSIELNRLVWQHGWCILQEIKVPCASLMIFVCRLVIN